MREPRTKKSLVHTDFLTDKLNFWNKYRSYFVRHRVKNDTLTARPIYVRVAPVHGRWNRINKYARAFRYPNPKGIVVPCRDDGCARYLLFINN